MNPDFLLKFGFSHKEATLYLAMLETGSSVVSDVVKKAGMNRSTGYVILESLIQRGLVTMSERNGVSVYTPAPPERLLEHLQDNARKYSDLVNAAQGLMPELKMLYTRPRVRYYEGLDGVQTAYEDTLTASEPIRAYCSIDNMHKALPEYFPEYYRRRAAKKIHARAIIPDTSEGRERVKNNQHEARTSRLVPEDAYTFSPEINIYDNKVVFFSWLEKFALMIESREIADALKKTFELSWIGTEHVQKTARPASIPAPPTRLSAAGSSG